MKKVLFASTALVLSAGVAAADVTVGGDGRMGILQRFGDDEIGFTSRIRISFAASGETDGGLTFGGSIRVDNGGLNAADENNDGFLSAQELNRGGADGKAGSVFISGAFGKLSMGDVDGAAEWAVGDVSGVGLTGLGDLNESTYLSNGSGLQRPTARYEYTTGAFGIALSADNPLNSSITVPTPCASGSTATGCFTTVSDGDEAMSVGVTYAGDMFSAGLGWENAGSIDHIIGGVSVTFAGATLKAIYGDASGSGTSGAQWGGSLDYAFGATTLTAYYYDSEELAGSQAWGVGAAYDLGGGAALKGGYVSNDTNDTDSFDFGISMSF